MIDPPKPMAHGGAETILVVEDNATLRQITRFVLESRGYRVIAVASAEGALQEWAKADGKIDLVFTDIHLPRGMSGQALATQLQAAKPTVRLLFASGTNPDDADTGFVLKEGVNFLRKPCELETLLVAVRTCLDKR